MGAVSTLANVGLNAALSRSKAKDDNARIKAQAERDISEVKTRDAADRKKRSDQLRRDLARQRALSASSGTGGSGGSAAAVRRGLKRQARDEDAAAVTERDLTIANIRGRSSAQRQRNLLDARSGLTKQAVGGAVSMSRSLLDL